MLCSVDLCDAERVDSTDTAEVASLHAEHYVAIEGSFTVVPLQEGLHGPDFGPDKLTAEVTDVPVICSLTADFINEG